MTDLNSREREAQLIRERDNYIEICTERLARAKRAEDRLKAVEAENLKLRAEPHEFKARAERAEAALAARALAVEALDEIGLVRVEIDLAESPYLLAVSQARNLGELLIEAADKLTHRDTERPDGERCGRCGLPRHPKLSGQIGGYCTCNVFVHPERPDEKLPER